MGDRKEIQIFKSFKEAEEAEYELWASYSPIERLAIGLELMYRVSPLAEFSKVPLRSNVAIRKIDQEDEDTFSI